MKKSRVLLFVSALLILAMALSSCGGKKPAALEDYLNLNYTPVEDYYSKASNLVDLEGYSVKTSNSAIVVFESVDEDEGEGEDEGKVTTSYKLFSMSTGKVVMELVGNKDRLYSFESVSYYPGMIVKQLTFDSASINMEPDAENLELVALAAAAREFYASGFVSSLLEDYVTETYTLYDATLAEVAVTKYLPEISSFAEYVVYDDVAYSVNAKTGAWAKAFDIPEYLALGDYVGYNDKYFYVEGDDGIISVYDKSFKLVYNYIAPNYSDESIVALDELDVGSGLFVLNDGNILSQYAVVLDEDAKKYDFTWFEGDTNIKMDLVTKLINIEDGEVEDLDLDFVIRYLATNDDLYDNKKEANENRFHNAFENIAVIAPIVDEKIQLSEDQIDIVMMENDAKVGASLKLVDNQATDIPEKIDDNLYAVSLIGGGYVLINAEGEAIASMNVMLEQVGDYFIGEDAIYSLDLEKEVNLKDPDVSYVVLGESILVTTKTSSKTYEVELLRDGVTKSVYTHTKNDETSLIVEEDYGYYYIVEESEDVTTYEYYNELGTKLVTTKRPLAVRNSSYRYGTLLLSAAPVEEGQDVIYYAFVK